MVIFLLGSVLCGLSASMIELVIFRTMQGVGAGCLLPVAQTIVADLYTLEQRPRVSAVMAGMFAVASIVGPFIGGVIDVTPQSGRGVLVHPALWMRGHASRRD